MKLNHDGMEFEVPATTIDKLAVALAGSPAPELRLRKATAVGFGGGGLGLVAANIGADTNTVQIACSCIELHADGDQLAVLANGPDLVCIGGLGIRGRLRLPSTTDVSLSSTGHAFQIGPDNGVNLRADVNEIMAVNNGAANTLALNFDGGDVTINGVRIPLFDVGTATVNITAATTGSVAVSYGVTFPSTPRCIPVIVSQTGYVPWISGASSSGCTINLRHINDASASPGNISVWWIAVG